MKRRRALSPGGFGGDSGPGSVLVSQRPDLTNWPTANTEHSAGDALKLGALVEFISSVCPNHEL